MARKIAVVLIALGLIGMALLVQRHARIRAAAELVRVQQRLEGHERSLAELRVQVAHRTRPDRLIEAAKRHGTEWRTIRDRTAEDVEIAPTRPRETGSRALPALRPAPPIGLEAR